MRAEEQSQSSYIPIRPPLKSTKKNKVCRRKGLCLITICFGRIEPGDRLPLNWNNLTWESPILCLLAFFIIGISLCKF